MSPKPAVPAPVPSEGEPEPSFIVPAEQPDADPFQEERTPVLEETKQRLAALMETLPDLDPNEVDTPPPLADEEVVG